MFGGLKNIGALAGIMKDLPKIRAKMDEVRQRLGELTVTAETGGGAVTASANGLLRITSIDINQSLLSGLIDPANPDDAAMASDLIVGAVNAALEKARQAAEQQMSAAAGELGLPLPPGGLSGLT